jgi:hypothetical protein
MSQNQSPQRGAGSGLRDRGVLAVLAWAAFALPAPAQTVSRTYTTDADFDEGILIDVNHDFPNNDQLQLDRFLMPSPFIFVPASGRGTILRVDVETGAIVGEYRSAPQGMGQDPSRTTVDSQGNCWAGNRARDILGLQGSVVKIGIVIGGTRVNASGVPDPNGQYLAPPYDYNTCVDRDGDGLIRTSRGLGDVLGWPDITDGQGGAGGGPALVEDAFDEAILVFQITGCPNVRHVSVDANDDVWAGGYPFQPTCFQRLSGVDGAIQQTLNTFNFCGGFGGTIDPSGLLWSASNIEAQLLRLNPVTNALNCYGTQPSPSGVAIAGNGTILVSGASEVRRYNQNGRVVNIYGVAGASGLIGIAVTPLDDDIWVASFDTDQVYRLSPSGTIKATIAVDRQPNGLSVDYAGRVWVVCLEGNSAQRINPATDSVDLTVPLGLGAQPYSPSQMTGSIDVDMTVPQGLWSVVFDGGVPNVHWGTVSYTSLEEQGSSLQALVRASNNPAQLPNLPLLPVGNGVPFDLSGRYIEIQVAFAKAPSLNVSPILFDLTVEGTIEDDPPPPGDCIKEHYRRPGSLLLYPEFDNTSGSVTVLTVTNRDCLGGNVRVEFIYIREQDCHEFNRTELLTPCDTLTLLTNVHNPNMQRGYVYAFAKSATTGEPVVHNHLIGNLLIVDGWNAFEYSVNPVAFRGIGMEGESTDKDGNSVRNLDGLEYAMAPDQVFVPRFLGQQPPVPGAGGHVSESELILIGLTGGKEFDVTLDFLIYNDNEEVFSSEVTFRCWERKRLLDISGIFSNDFLANWTNHNPNEVFGAPAIESGWFRMDGAVANSVATSIPDPAFYAVLIERIGQYAAADLPFEYCTQPNGGLVFSGLLGDQ